MKTWLNKVFGKEPNPASAAVGKPAAAPAPQADAERTILAAEERTVPAAAPHNPRAIQAAEGQVAAEWNVGDVILDLYEVKQVHEGGGMGLVYRVHHRDWNMDLAVKSPRAEYFLTEAQKENFVRECETWINLGLHPHIVSCHYVRTLGGVPRVFIEYVESGTLSEWIQSRKLYASGPKEALKRMLDVAIQFAWGLDYAHNKGLIHQDVKPSNVMMMPDGTVKLTDFGLAKARGATAEDGASDTQRSILASYGGMTPAYCSPEQADIRAKRTVGLPEDQLPKLTRRTDIWSWAVSVLEMFYGELPCPHGGQAAGEVLESFLSTPFDLGAIPAMPKEVAGLLRACFERDIQRRTKDFKEVAKCLVGIYRIVAGEDYERKTPAPADLLADALNNQALSFLDLGMQVKAQELWNKATAIDAHHVQANYNTGLFEWRSAKADDQTLIRRLREVGQSGGDSRRIALLTARVCMENDDCASAIKALEGVAIGGSNDDEIRTALTTARQQLPTSRRCLQIFEGHRGAVNSVCLSADGKHGLSGSSDKTLKLWEVTTGRLLRTLKGHKGEVTAISMNADGRYALSGSADGRFRLWDLATGKCRTNWGQQYGPRAVYLLNDGKQAVSIGDNSLTMKLWEVATGRCLRVFPGWFNTAFPTSDNRFVFAGNSEGILELWDLQTGCLLRSFQDGKSNNLQSDAPIGVLAVALSLDNRYGASAHRGGHLCLWDLATGTCLRKLMGHVTSAQSVCYVNGNSFLVSGGVDGKLKLWETATGRCLRTFEGNVDGVLAVSVSDDGQYALAGDAYGRLELFNVIGNGSRHLAPYELSAVAKSDESSVASAKYRSLVKEAAHALEISDLNAAVERLEQARSLPGYRRQKLALSKWMDLYVHLTKTKLTGAWEMLSFREHKSAIESLSLSADGRVALSGDSYGTLKLWDVTTGRCVRTFEYGNSINAASLSCDGRLVLAGGYGAFKAWETATGKYVRSVEGFEVASLALSGEGRFAVVAGMDILNRDQRETIDINYGNSDQCMCRVWDIPSGRCLRVLNGHQGIANSVCFSADGRFILSGAFDKSLKVWETATGRCLRTLTGHDGIVLGVCFSRDARFALSGASDKMVKLWELASGRCLRTFEGHEEMVKAVALSPDGRFALTGGDTMRLWETATGCCLRTFEGHAGSVSAVCLSADGCYALSGSEDGSVKVWCLDWGLGTQPLGDWDEGARPWLADFLSIHTPYVATLPSNREPDADEITLALTRKGKPNWTEDDFQNLLFTLGCAGFGWIGSEGVRRQLEKMAAEWQGSPLLPWEHAS